MFWNGNFFLCILFFFGDFDDFENLDFDLEMIRFKKSWKEDGKKIAFDHASEMDLPNHV